MQHRVAAVLAASAIRDGPLSSSITDDPTDADVQPYHATMRKYGQPTTRPGAAGGFVVLLALVRALIGQPRAVDAASIITALSARPSSRGAAHGWRYHLPFAAADPSRSW